MKKKLIIVLSISTILFLLSVCSLIIININNNLQINKIEETKKNKIKEIENAPFYQLGFFYDTDYSNLIDSSLQLSDAFITDEKISNVELKQDGNDTKTLFYFTDDGLAVFNTVCQNLVDNGGGYIAIYIYKDHQPYGLLSCPAVTTEYIFSNPVYITSSDSHLAQNIIDNSSSIQINQHTNNANSEILKIKQHTPWAFLISLSVIFFLSTATLLIVFLRYRTRPL